MKPRLNIQQKLTAFTNMYRVFEANEALESTQLKAFAQQKKLAMKEQVTFYSDEQKTKPTFSFRAEKVLDVHGRYFVEDSDGTRIGMFKKEFTKSLTNSTWQVMDADGKPLFIVKESNEFLALARRIVGIIPIFGELLEMALFFINYHFVFIDSETNEIVGKYQKTTMFRDHYLLYMTDDGFAKVDWRVFASMGVALDALQSR
jgi:hypothetical protein